jgi:hypothetical protein
MFKTCSCMGSQAKAMPDQCLGATTWARRHEALTRRHAEHVLCMAARSGGAKHPATKDARVEGSKAQLFSAFRLRVVRVSGGIACEGFRAPPDLSLKKFSARRCWRALR